VATFELSRPVAAATVLEEVAFEPTGVVELRGWTRRHDLVEPERVPLGAGFVCQFMAPERSYERLGLLWGGSLVLDNRMALVVQTPHYVDLLISDRPLQRRDIYGSGPPVPVVSADIAAASLWLRGRVLDFGCGAGALVQHLRSRGVEASGIELDRPELRRATLPEAAPHTLFYDGGLPSPLPSDDYDSIACIEVIEHIEDYEAAFDELARLTRDLLLLTTPDLSAIPVLHRHQVVPWHLLEATHVSFFTQASLTAQLSRRFTSVELFRIGANQVNGTLYYTSLLAVCRGPRSVSLLDER
jgi:2-polyprenyl-3-methyl-5-hydroxy-6-metoxy-1,4-benzoquinol methylase